MSSRLVGAVLALTAAALLATSIVTGALWSGPPTVMTESGSRTIDKKTVHVGLLGAQGCNTGGDGKCQSVELAGAFPAVGYGALGAQALLLLLLLVLAGTSFAKSNSRRNIAKFALIAAIAAAAVVGALVAIGPAFKDGHISVPIGYGMFLFAGAVVATIAASVLAPKDDPPPKLRPSRTPPQPQPQPHLPAPPPQPEFNVEQFFAPEPAPLRPSRPSYPPPPMGVNGPMGHGPMAPNGPMFGQSPSGPIGNGSNGPVDPMAATLMGNGPAAQPNPRPPIGIGPPPPASPGGMLPGPAGPLGASSAPMFGEQPAFSPPQFPPGFGARPEGEPNTAPPPGPRTKSTSVVPPPRAKPASIAPPIPGLPSGPRTKPASLAPLAFKVPTIPPFISASSAGPALPGLPPPMTAPPDESTDPEAKALRPATNTGMGVNENTDMTAMPVSDEEARATMQTPAVDRESVSDLAETTARPKMDPEEFEATNDIGKLAAAFKAANTADEAVTTPRRETTGAPAPRRDSKPAIDDDPDALAKIPVTTASEDLPPPKEEKAAPGPQPACPQCEAPMTWVEEHLRFYCKSCRMYF
ncbi:MAG TPA: hypothetical protein VGM90_05995 [Kofleriaceae bacterium]|jgi:hypothetical protein